MTMRSSEIKAEILSHMLYRLRFKAVVTEYGGVGVSGIADVFGITDSGYTHEFEVKVSKSDLMGELEAIRSMFNSPRLLGKSQRHISKGSKHNLYLGKSLNQETWDQVFVRPNCFSFAVPSVLSDFAKEFLSNTPYGLYVITLHENGGHPWTEVFCEKKAAKLHKNKPPSDVHENITRKACSEVAVLRAKIRKGNICTHCDSVLPSRCDGCEKKIAGNRAYNRAHRKAQETCFDRCKDNMAGFTSCMSEEMAKELS